MDLELEDFESILSPVKVLIKDEVHETVNFIIEEGPCISSSSSDTGEGDIGDHELLLNTDKNPLNDIVDELSALENTKTVAKCRKKKIKINSTVKNSNVDKVRKENFANISKEFRCTICDEGFSKKEPYEIHQSGHANNLRCDLCTTVLKNMKNYEKHVVNCKPFECKLCGKIIRFRPNFIKHMRIHNPKNVKSKDNKKIPKSERHKYRCDVCKKEFTSWEYFKVHKKIHEENVNLTCKICGKVFSAFACLKGHQKVHTGEKPFRCEVCGKGFSQSYNLKIHSRLHSGEKPFECKTCGRKMNTTASYSAHLKTHKNYKCEICNEIFNQKIKYMSHMGMHETGKVLECNICGKKFGRSSNFYNHQRIHLGIKKFKCYICGNGFIKAANLDAHLLVHCKNNDNLSDEQDDTTTSSINSININN